MSPLIYIGDEDGVDGEVIVERPSGNVGVHFAIEGKIVASAFLDPYHLGVLVGQLSASAPEGVAATTAEARHIDDEEDAA